MIARSKTQKPQRTRGANGKRTTCTNTGLRLPRMLHGKSTTSSPGSSHESYSSRTSPSKPPGGQETTESICAAHSSATTLDHVYGGDDNLLPDQLYQNPYYMLPIKDVLWLSLNPIGTLDLDMTATMNVALTSEPGAGPLGPLTEMVISVGSVFSGLTADSESGTSVSDGEMSINGLAFDRTEEIELTSTIASRVQNLKSEGDVSTPDQQSESLRTRPRPRTSGSVTGQNKHPGPDLLTGSITRLPLTSSPPNSPAAPTTTSEVSPAPPVSPSLSAGSLRLVTSGPLLGDMGAVERRTYPWYTSMDEAGRMAIQYPMQSSYPRCLSELHEFNRLVFVPPPSLSL